MDKIKPCPFCGGEGKIVRHFHSEGGKPFWSVECCNRNSNQKRLAADLWNRRAHAAQPAPEKP